jgi:hypothetical protein
VKGAQFRGHRDSQRRSKEGIFRQGEANQLFKVKNGLNYNFLNVFVNNDFHDS